MPICIECRYPVPQLYHVLHGAQTPAVAPTSINGGSRGGGESKKAVGGGDVRLTQCPRCKRFADKYVEHDFVVLFIDLVLVKPQVYRHLLFNRLGREDDAFDPSIKRLGTLLLLFDVYLTWSSIEALPAALSAFSPIPSLPILAQYAFYLLLCSLTTLAQHLAIRSLARVEAFRGAAIDAASPPPSRSGCSSSSSSSTTGSGVGNGAGASASASTSPLPPNRSPSTTTMIPTSKPNAISTALFVSSCMRLFPILMVVWKYDDVGGQVGWSVEWAVAVQNLEALRILLECSYLGAAVLVAVGLLARVLVKRLVLGMVGLGSVAGMV